MKVAVAIIMDEQQQILVTQRPLHASHGGLWEFPGGKLEPNESAEQALIREIKEEIDLEVIQYHFLGTITHEYSNQLVELLVFQVTQFAGIPKCLEGQPDIKWVKKDKLNNEDFPEANQEIFDLYLVSSL